MTAVALAGNIPFSVITIADGSRRSPAWKALLGLPRFGDADVGSAGDTPAQRDVWAARLDRAVTSAERPVLLVANGASCHAAAWWARLSPASYVERVAGALLFDPFGRAGGAEMPGRYAAPPVVLPFPSAIIRGKAPRRSDALLDTLAGSWGSGILDVPRQEQVEGVGAWHQAHALLLRVTARVVDRDLRIVDTLSIDR